MSCMGCGGQLMTGGCSNQDCAFAMGGTYLNGVKVRTASGRSLVPELADDWPCHMYGPWVTRCRHHSCKPEKTK